MPKRVLGASIECSYSFPGLNSFGSSCKGFHLASTSKAKLSEFSHSDYRSGLHTFAKTGSVSPRSERVARLQDPAGVTSSFEALN